VTPTRKVISWVSLVKAFFSGSSKVSVVMRIKSGSSIIGSLKCSPGCNGPACGSMTLPKRLTKAMSVCGTTK
jgi:hypothetical protein